MRVFSAHRDLNATRRLIQTPRGHPSIKNANSSSRTCCSVDGRLYGTAYGFPDEAGEDNSNDGSIFELVPGVVAVLYNFGEAQYTGDPLAGLVQATDGNFYGTTLYGGTSQHDGTVFQFSTGLGPFVKTLPTSGVVGSTVRILGTDLTGTSSVTFNGAAAAFFVRPSEIVAVVPVGATTGKVQVITPRGALLGNPIFLVRPK
jgi:uncharacterized repeat protein (TIGR03803 family)